MEQLINKKAIWINPIFTVGLLQDCYKFTINKIEDLHNGEYKAFDINGKWYIFSRFRTEKDYVILFDE